MVTSEMLEKMYKQIQQAQTEEEADLLWYIYDRALETYVSEGELKNEN